MTIRRALLTLLLFASPALAAEMPRINIETLERSHPGWTVLEKSGDPNSGVMTVERDVWPMFYLHWFPMEQTGKTLGAGEAEKMITGLWDGLVIDTPLKAVKTMLPAHEGFEIEATTSHGEMKNRYFVWACPQSGRVFIADTNLNSTVNTPQILLDWLRDMAHTVRCHADAPVETFPHLSKPHDVKGGEVSYAMPPLWASIEGYRIQTTFGGSDFAATHPAISPERGQELAVASDALLRVYLTWRPAPDDFPMTYDVLKQETQDFWLPRAANLMMDEMRGIRGIWVIDGRVRPGPHAAHIPPARDHKFRGWLWRKDGTLYYAAGTIAGIRIGRRFPAQTLKTWDGVLEGMYQSILY